MKVVAGIVCVLCLAACGEDYQMPVDPPLPTFSSAPAIAPDPTSDRASVQVDAAVGQAGLHASGFVGSPSTMVSSTCENMRMPGSFGSAAEILDLQIDGQRQALKIFQIGIPLLCPDQAEALREVVEGNIPFGSGTYDIGTERGQVRPGTYRTTSVVDNCYWERTDPKGRVIAKSTVPHANSVSVTIRPGDGSFTNDRCGAWKRVG
ncbi:hypothetical protein [Actinocrispum sp. NPDC049592]|uniref:hypothetical protein n=1 Tax=Actinocrispum sp. NPDC049592 TaxID=3154835 RepID=UPI00342C5478